MFFKSASDFNNKGLQLLETGELQAALTQFQKSIQKSDGSEPVYYWNVGFTQMHLGNLAEAENHIQYAAEHGVDHAIHYFQAQDWNQAGINALEEENFAQAEECFEYIIFTY